MPNKIRANDLFKAINTADSTINTAAVPGVIIPFKAKPSINVMALTIPNMSNFFTIFYMTGNMKLVLVCERKKEDATV